MVIMLQASVAKKNAYRVDNLSLEMFDFGSLKIIGFLVKYRDEIGWG